MSSPNGLGEGRLESWKEIAAYLGREVRTVQGWEKTEGLPIHRHQHARQGSVFAFKSELDAWRDERKISSESAATPPVVPPDTRVPFWTWTRLLAATVTVVLAIIAVWKATHQTPGETITSVVVLPFKDYSPGHDQEYFSDGLTEEIIDAVSRVPNLRVVARTSAFSFKGNDTDVRKIAGQLNVGAVLEGSVRKSGDELRITAQLNRASDGTHLWSHEYDKRLTDVFAVQHDIAEQIASNLRAGSAPPAAPTDVRNAEAYRLLQEGRYFFNKFEAPDANMKAIERFQQAIALDPKMAAAYSGLADAQAYLAETMAARPTEVMPKAQEAAKKAVELDPNSAAAHTSLGTVMLDYDRDIEGGQREFLRAMKLNPGSAYSHHWYAHSLEAQNKLPEALREMRVALDMDPLSIAINWDVGNELICARQFSEAVTHLNKAHELFSGNPIIEYLRVEAYHRAGDRDGERKTVDALRATPGLDEVPIFLALFGAAAARDGRMDEARRDLDRLEKMQKTQYVEGFLVVELCMELHEKASAIEWLRRAERERSPFFVYRRMMSEYFRMYPTVLQDAFGS
jgi:TolB-like protein/Flp pilus assembly protein TadD